MGVLTQVAGSEGGAGKGKGTGVGVGQGVEKRDVKKVGIQKG